MSSKRSNSLATVSTPEVALHLWPSGEQHRPADWRAIQNILFRRRALLLGTFGGTLLFLLIALWMLPPVYRATSTLQVNTAASYTNENELPVLSDLTGVNQSRSLVTQTEILQNDAVRERAISSLAAADREAVNGQSVSVKSIPETDLITVSGISRNPHAAAALSNALCDAYLQLSQEKNRLQYASARQYVGKQLDQTRSRLNQARQAMRRYKQSNGTVDLTAETQNQLGELNRIQSEFRQAQADKQAAQAQLNELKRTLPSLKSSVVANSTIARSPSLTAVQARLTETELKRTEALQEYQPNSPEVQALNTQIASLRAQLRQQAQTEVQSLQQAPNPLRVDAEQNIQRLQGEIWSLQARATELQTLAKRVSSNLERLPAREQQMGQLTTDLAGLQQSYETLNQKYQTLRASEAARVASGSLLFPARVPTQPMRRLTPINMLVCIILALLISLATASLADRVDDHVRSARDLPLDSDLNVLAQIPRVPDSSELCLINTRAMVSPLLENFRTLRTMLALSSTAEGGVPARLLAVTSSVPKEGKSLVSVNLAVAAALSGERVILVDCDLRWPTLHSLCGRSNNVGFINVATGETPLEAALQTTRVPNLRVLTSGPRSTNPFHALNSRLGREMLQTLAQMADLVIIDTPPVMVLADARLTAAMCDSVLLVVSTEEPSKEDVVLATELLAKSGASVAGIVLNKVDPGSGYRDYYSLYPYYNPNNDALALGTNSAPARTPIAGNTMVPHVPSGGGRAE